MTGYISDLKCAKEGRPKEITDHTQCAERCVADGEPIAFLSSNSKVYLLENPQHALSHLGKFVDVKGTSVGHAKLRRQQRGRRGTRGQRQGSLRKAGPSAA